MNTSQKLVFALFGLFIGLTLVGASAYRLSEWEQAIITQFGKPIGESITKAGLHFKKPFVQKIRRLDKRILNWDGNPNQIPTKDKKYIWVDTTARWRIQDPLLFIQTVQTERGALSRLDGIMEAAARDTISNHKLVEAVRNSNSILAKLNASAQIQNQDLSGLDEEVVGDIEEIKVGREKLSEMILEKARKGLSEFGIEIIDVQLRRISYEASVEKKVYDRMISERKRIAQKIRSVGQGEKAKIEGKIDKDLKEIQSAAYRTAQKIKGTADNKAIRIYAKAMNADPAFYEFVRTLDAYKEALPEGISMILSTDNEFLDLLRKRK